MSLSALFGRPKIPNVPAPIPPKPVRNTELEAQMSAMGRRSGILQALFGAGKGGGGSSNSTSGHTLTGQ